MAGRVNYALVIVLILLGELFSSGTGLSMHGREAIVQRDVLGSDQGTVPASATMKDITTPITTVPTIIPTTPYSTSPMLNPNSNPDSTSPMTNTIPTSTNSPAVSSGVSWCVASQSASQTALQVGLDYACGYGADCSAIQPGGSCYNPSSVRDLASYAFNKYYQKNPVPSSCRFGGTAIITSTDPSTGICQYPSTSTSESILNTTNTSGATVFGAVPMTPPPSAAAAKSNTLLRRIILWFLAWMAEKCMKGSGLLACLNMSMVQASQHRNGGLTL